MQKWSDRHEPLPMALLMILGSVFLFSGMTFTIFRAYRHSVNQKLADQRYVITSIRQTGPIKGVVNTQYLAELLGLSIDHPTHLYEFNEGEGESKLMQASLFESVHIEKKKPSTISVDYSLRRPCALLMDFSNTALDDQGYFFPYRPFFSPKSIPQIYLGLHESTPPEGKKALELAMNLLEIYDNKLKQTRASVERIDVSKAYHPSFGKREIVVIIGETLHAKGREYKTEYLLRLNCSRYKKNLGEFLALRKELLKKLEKNVARGNQPLLERKTIDLRLENFAYIEE